MRRWIRRIVRFIAAIFLLVITCIVVEIAIGWHCKLEGEIHASAPQPADRKAATADIKDYSRPEDDTLLSYPEWYIVWSYQEKADFQQHNLPSGFPYFGAVGQYWGSYCCISRLIRGSYPFNVGEQVMLVVIGTSFSVEYTLKGAYEKTIGRMTEWTSGGNFTEEDKFASQVARDYADFVHVRPFYEFHFAPRVPALWHETSLFGPHWARKWERKLFLTIDYSLEAFYCWIIEKLTHLSYGFEPAETYSWVENAGKDTLALVPHVRIVKQVGPGAFVIDIPRYQEFTKVASKLAEQHVRFVEIAGNSQILLSVIAPRGGSRATNVLFSTPVLTNPASEREVILSDVSSLTSLLNSLQSSGSTLEHIYDY